MPDRRTCSSCRNLNAASGGQWRTTAKGLLRWQCGACVRLASNRRAGVPEVRPDERRKWWN